MDFKGIGIQNTEGDNLFNQMVTNRYVKID